MYRAITPPTVVRFARLQAAIITDVAAGWAIWTEAWRLFHSTTQRAWTAVRPACRPGAGAAPWRARRAACQNPAVTRRRRAEHATSISLHKGSGTRYRSTLQRTDGVLIALEGGSWNRIGGSVVRVPHDLAHLVVEQELGLEFGLWGVLAG